MVALAQYKTTRLVRTSSRGAVYEAERKRDGKRVLAKIFDVDSESDEARVEHEYRLLEQLDLEGVVRPVGLERVGRQLVLLLDWVEGRDLGADAGGQPLALELFLARAQDMAEILARIHRRGIVHRDIKPSNVMIEAGSGKIVFADFGISVLLEDEGRRQHEREVLEGTLPYVSPEQTGRTKGEVDYRSDLYSLGVTFYELLTGVRPFESHNPIELIHAHLAQRPRPPEQLRPELPAQLSAMVLKLLEKAPERRYQSARGLAADLARLRRELDAGIADPRFALAKHDIASTLQFPHQLYGREPEQARLAEALAACVAGGPRRLILLGGAAGSGKSSLVRSCEGQLALAGGLMGVGKFEPLGGSEGEVGAASDQPLGAFIEVFAELVQRILTSSEVQLRRWRGRLRRELGPLAAVVAELVPDLGLVMGELGSVPLLEFGEARNRMLLGLRRFVGALAEAGPVVIVLDDLQWADEASLELLISLVHEPRAGVLFVASYRSDAAEAEARIQALEAQLEPGIAVDKIELGPLEPAALEQLLVDTLNHTPEAIHELARVVERKTGSNPLLVRLFLRHLADAGLLRAGESGWVWSVEAIASEAVPDDLLGVLAARLERLPARERGVLERAACIGLRFEYAVLEAIVELEREVLSTVLYELCQAGLIAAVGAGYRFSHEHIQHSARASLASEARIPVHRAIGLALLATAPSPRGDAVFAIVDQLELGLPELDALEPELRASVVELALEAGERSLNSGGWSAALRYFEAATTACGEARDGEAFAAQFGRAQSLELSGAHEVADEAFAALLEWDLSLNEYARVTGRRIWILELLQRYEEATEYALRSLAHCGLRLPRAPSLPRMLVEVLGAWRKVGKWNLDELLAMPAATDEQALAQMHVLEAMKVSAFSFEPLLYVVVVAVHARAIARFGYHDSAVGALAQIAFVASGMGYVEDAQRLATAALELGQRREAPSLVRAEGSMNWLCFVAPTGLRFREIAERVERSFLDAVEGGARRAAGYIGSLGLMLALESDMHLGEVRSLERTIVAQLSDFGSDETGALGAIARCLIGTLSAEDEADEPSFAEPGAIAELGLAPATHYGIVLGTAWGHVLLGELETAWAELETVAADFEQVMFGIWTIPRFAALDALLAADRARASTGFERRRLVRRLRKRLAVLRKWAASCPDNFACLVELVGAELAWLRGRWTEAVDGFERARSQASEHQRSYVELLAATRHATLAESRGWESAARGAWRTAHEVATRWGAWAIVRRLERDHPELVDVRARALRGSSEGRTGSLATGSLALDSSSRSFESVGSHESSRSYVHSSDPSVSSLDIHSVLDTMQAISEDLRLDQVIARVLDSAIANAGADRGLLLLDRAGTVAVVARADESTAEVMLEGGPTLHEAEDMLASSLANLVLRTGQPVVVDDALADPRFAADPYVRRTGVRSLLGMPITKNEEQIGALVLENHLGAGAFSEERLATLRILLGQGASALDNGRLYAQLQRSEAQWRSLVDGVPDIIMLLDAEGHVDFVNHVGRGEVFELEGLAADAGMDAVSTMAWGEALRAVVETGGVRELEVCIEATAAGPKRFFQTRTAPVPQTEAASAARYLSIWTDVTKAKSLEAQVRQQQRLESIGTLAAGVAHEINNPVQGILSYAELLGLDADKPEVVHEFAADIIHEAERVTRIVRSLLAFSRQEVAQPLAEHAVEDLIDDALSLVRAVLRKDAIAIEVDIARGLPPIACRMQQIQQILMNLVTNARDALNERYPGADPDKRIAIRAEAVEREAQTWVRISVEDRAGGIPEHVRARIFDPFFTTKTRDQGTGLGLAVSHGIAVEHGGELSVETELGQGSRFHLSLPAAALAASKARGSFQLAATRSA